MINNKSKQFGITLIEFSIVASVFLLILFAIFEIAIFAFSLQSMNDISRRTARIAAVCVVNDADIRTLALSEWVPKDFTVENIEITYLDANGTAVGDPVTNQSSVRYVQSRIVNFNYGFSGLLNFLGDNGIVIVPDFQTILPAESLGVLRLDDPDAKTDC